MPPAAGRSGPGRIHALGPTASCTSRTRRSAPSSALPPPVALDPAYELVFDWRDGDVL